uniref:Uncharacterized protein n=1 Tax=Strigamia maritima TaxID=126957 RepID=T1IZZ5_STRMM
MVHLTCNCLNIRIHAKSTCAAEVKLANTELADAFFQDGSFLAVTLDLAGVTKEVPCLVKARCAGGWKVHNCVNCGKDVYATDSAGENILVSKNLKTDAAELNSMMQSEAYSPLYKVVIQSKQQAPIKKNLTLDLNTHRSEALDRTMQSLQQQLTRFLQLEQSAVEERIKSYAEQQQTLFSFLQNRVRQDKQAIASLLMQTEEHDLETALSDAMIDNTPGLTPPMTPVGNTDQSSSPDNGKYRDALNSEEADQVISEIPKATLVRQRPQSFTRPFNSKLRRKGVYNAPKIAQSLDTDGIFDLDGVEEEMSPFFQCDDDLDSAIDDTSNDDDVFDNRDVFSSGQMSLPISMPQWTQNRHMELPSDEDDDNSRIPINDPEQIAASIKAMARSVHQSDTTEMFGDLPRPRLNTMN